MSSLVLTGDTSGQVTLAAPAVAGSNTITLQAATGTMSVNTLGTVNSGGANPFNNTLTFVDFTGLPSWVKRLTVMFNSVSTSSTSGMLLQLGYQSPVTNTGYLSGTSAIGNSVVGSLTTSTAGILASSALVAAQSLNGAVVFTTLGSNVWVAQGNTYSSATATFVVAGSVTLSGTLDRVRITTIGGADTFDAGSINILYEG
jgi:hypothetical protein